MTITKCDVCKKTIIRDDRKFLVMTSSPYRSFEFCQKCGKPIEQFLLKNKLITIPNKSDNKK